MGTMAHRGPDDSGCWISAERMVGLGHQRLSIVDLTEAGRQPMSNKDGSIWITYNGEIYNHERLRTQLKRAGHSFTSRTDTETILHAYEEWGIDCVQRFEGMFAFCLFDVKSQSCYLVRDRVGVKPLYYAKVDDDVVFASEIKAILSTGLIRPEIDSESVYHYFTFMTTPAPATMFKNISKLPAGHIMTLTRTEQAHLYPYWQPVQTGDIPTFRRESEEEEFHVGRVRTLFQEAVEKRTMSDVPFGVFLSGGVDSSLNTAFMSRCISAPVKTLSVGYAGKDTKQYDELGYAREVSNLFKTEHHEVIIGYPEVEAFIEDMVFYQDEPIADPVCVPIYYVSKLARDNGIKVVNVGEGSDELFSGYDYWHSIYRWANRKHIVGFLSHAIGMNSRPGFLQKAYDRINWLLREGLPPREIFRKHLDGQEYFWGGAIVATDRDKRHGFFSKEFIQGFPADSSYEIVKQLYHDARRLSSGRDTLAEWAFLDLRLRLPELLLMRVDKMGMAASIEGRVPFLDHKLIECAMNIPAKWKIRNGTTKYILKRVAEGILPHHLIYRKKIGFPSPVHSWMHEGLLRLAENKILSSRLVELNILDYTQLREEFVHFERTGSADLGKVWLALNLTMWYDRWVA